MADRLRSLWDFTDLDVTDQHLRDQLAAETTVDGQAEVLTQLARVAGLRDDFDGGAALILEAERVAISGVARCRIDLERGRLLRSSGQLEAALPLFESAFNLALEASEYFIAVDAAHMAALASSDHDRFVSWTNRGIELADRYTEARYWRGSLLNNLGWEFFDSGDLEAALEAFERALECRMAEPGNESAIEVARYAVAKTLRSLGRAFDAVPLLQRAVAWADSVGEPDGWFHEELAEVYAALGREAEAGEQARLALPLLTDADPSFTNNAERIARLRFLADRPSATDGALEAG